MTIHPFPSSLRLAKLLWGALLTGLLAMPARAQHDLEITGLPDDAPFSVTAWADASRLVIDLHLRSDWHAYSRDVGGGEPLRISFAKDSGIHALGKLRLPKDHEGQLTGHVRIEQWIRVDEGSHQLDATLDFMVCDAMRCLPPIQLCLRGKITPLRVLLVTSGKDAFTERIHAFLVKRGFEASVSTYDTVDVDTCDRHDLVLAASKLFREDGKGGRKASSFPRTQRPIVAVGFLGTRLIENHGLAMASGYI